MQIYSSQCIKEIVRVKSLNDLLMFEWFYMFNIEACRYCSQMWKFLSHWENIADMQVPFNFFPRISGLPTLPETR